jgi:bacterioferritin
MIETTHGNHEVKAVTREDLVAFLNEDLAGEYQAIISYVIYSQVIKGAQYMNIAAELETHAAEQLEHALIIAGQIDYLGGMPQAVAKPVQTSAKAEDMLRFDLENENRTIARYRQRVRQCEALGEYAVAEQIRDILVQEQDHQIALATALDVEVPNVMQLEVKGVEDETRGCSNSDCQSGLDRHSRVLRGNQVIEQTGIENPYA